jgi:hypothetical protein
MSGRLLLLLPLAAVLVVPAAAEAADAGRIAVVRSTETDYGIREDYTYTVVRLRYRGTRAASDLSVHFAKRGRVTLVDRGGVRAGKGCRQVGPERARCRVRRGNADTIQAPDFFLGRGDDALRLRGGARGGMVTVDGGAGDDRVRGSAGRDGLFPGAGDDRVNGGPGADLLDADGGADDLAGGGGFDRLGYERRTAGVHVDLEGDADDGSPGEGDRVRPDVESVVGGKGADELVGNARRNVLDGGADGVDVLVGGDGDDSLRTHRPGGRLEGGDGDDFLFSNYAAAFVGGPGRDVLFAGSHDSTLAADDGEPDELRCADPAATAATADALDVVLACAAIARSGPPGPRFVFSLGQGGYPLADVVIRRVHRYARTLSAYVACSSDMPAPCAARVVLRDADGVLIDETVSVEPGSFARVERMVGRGVRRTLGNREYSLRLEGTDAAGAPVIVEERGLRAA